MNSGLSSQDAALQIFQKKFVYRIRSDEEIQIAQKAKSTGAAVESFRNEVVNANYQNQELYKEALKQQIIPAHITPLNQPINILQEAQD